MRAALARSDTSIVPPTVPGRGGAGRQPHRPLRSAAHSGSARRGGTSCARTALCALLGPTASTVRLAVRRSAPVVPAPPGADSRPDGAQQPDPCLVDQSETALEIL